MTGRTTMPDTTRHLQLVHSEPGDGEVGPKRLSEAAQALLAAVHDGHIVWEGDFGYLDFDFADVEWTNELLSNTIRELVEIYPNEMVVGVYQETRFVAWVGDDAQDSISDALRRSVELPTRQVGRIDKIRGAILRSV